MMEIIQGLPEDVVAVVASDKVTGEDYDNVLIPAITEKIKKHDKIRMLYQISRDFTGLTFDAMREDAKVSWHMTAFEKVAVVSDVHWINDSLKIFKFVIPIPVKLFSNDEFDKAKAWISE
jgi:hypothetical protein